MTKTPSPEGGWIFWGLDWKSKDCAPIRALWHLIHSVTLTQFLADKQIECGFRETCPHSPPKKKKKRKEEWGVDSAPGGIHTNGSEIKVERE